MAEFVANYILDIGYQFNLVSIYVVTTKNSPTTAFDPESILPNSYLSLLKVSEFSCKLCGINPRKIEVTMGSGHTVLIDVPLPFSSAQSQQIIEDLKSNDSINSIKTIGERIQAFTYKEVVWR